MEGCITIRGLLYLRGQLPQLGRRREWTTLVLLFLVAVGLAEPLACLTHCRLLIQSELHRAFVGQHQDHSPLASGFDPLDVEGRELLHVRPVVLSNLFVCFMDTEHGSQSDLPYVPSPVLFHEHLAVFLAGLLLVLILLVRQRPVPSFHAPPPHTFRPLLRPPKALAA